MNKLTILGFCLLLFTSGFASASIYRTGELTDSVGLELGTQSFLTDPRFDGQSNFYSTFGIEADWKNSSESFWSYRLNPEILVSTQDPMGFNFVTAHNAYFGFPFLQVGRKTIPWFETDNVWGYSTFSPRHRFDPLQTRQQGLTGLFAEYKRKHLQIDAYGSWLHIPEQGAPVTVTDSGEVKSKNRWARIPPNQAVILGRSVPVRYSVKLPPYSQLLFRPGAGITARLGPEIIGPFSRLSYAYKPMNPLVFGYEAYLDMRPGAENAQVIAYPHVRHHHVGAFEGGWNFTGDFKILGSFFRDVPEKDTVVRPREWTVQGTGPASGVGGYIEFPVVEKSWLQVRTGYTQVMGGTAPDRGELAVAGVSIFESRYTYEKAVLVEGSTRLGNLLGERLTLRTKGIFEFDQSGTLLSSGLGYSFNKDLNVQMSADLLGYSGPANPQAKNTFFYNFRGNDRVSGALQYVF